MELEERHELAQAERAEPRVAAAAEPHKRRAVAAGTAVGATVRVGGNGEDKHMDSMCVMAKGKQTYLGLTL
eukprot:2440090-Prymnesium_polylepis.1